jgi:DNA processing protein
VTGEFAAEKLLGPLNEVEKKNAPPALFISGRKELLKRRPRISIIGSREASEAGLRAAKEIAAAVVLRGGVVVSGLARGVDTAAHTSAMEQGGDTIAVLGTPLSRAYPKENALLQERLKAEQLVVTQFGEDQATLPNSFVLRNRTMALVSNGSVIVEAGEGSGTQHQGWEALRLGRVLFLPKSLADGSFEWPRKMVSYGALVFDGVEDFEELLDEFLPQVPEPQAKEPSELRF